MCFSIIPLASREYFGGSSFFFFGTTESYPLSYFSGFNFSFLCDEVTPHATIVVTLQFSKHGTGLSLALLLEGQNSKLAYTMFSVLFLDRS